MIILTTCSTWIWGFLQRVWHLKRAFFTWNKLDVLCSQAWKNNDFYSERCAHPIRQMKDYEWPLSGLLANATLTPSHQPISRRFLPTTLEATKPSYDPLSPASHMVIHLGLLVRNMFPLPNSHPSIRTSPTYIQAPFVPSLSNKNPQLWQKDPQLGLTN